MPMFQIAPTGSQTRVAVSPGAPVMTPYQAMLARNAAAAAAAAKYRGTRGMMGDWTTDNLQNRMFQLPRSYNYQQPMPQPAYQAAGPRNVNQMPHSQQLQSFLSAPSGWNPRNGGGMRFGPAMAMATQPGGFNGLGGKRTDLTQDIDGAFASRNLGSKHWSEVARSGNGNMRNDLADYDTRDMRIVDGVGECYECMGLIESTRFDGLGAIGPGTGIAQYRYPTNGETPPYAPQFGFVWLRKLSPTGQRATGGTNVNKAQWVLVSKAKLADIQKQGDLKGFGQSSALPGMGGLRGMGDLSAETLAISAGVGIVGGIVLWLALKGIKSKKAAAG